MTAPPRLADADARARIATDLDTTLVVEAAAGTGKTTELVRRIVRVLAEGRATMSGIVGVTFTEKAAGELKLRLRESLEAARTEASIASEAHAHLDRALRSLEEAHLGTIHAFCADLLREHPVEAGIDPLFAVLTEPQARRVFREAFDGWFERTLQAPPEGVRRSLRRSSRAGVGDDADADGPVDRLRRAAWDLCEWRDCQTPWTRPSYEREVDIRRLADDVRRFADLTRHPAKRSDPLFVDTDVARRTSDDLERLIAADDLDGAEARLVDLKRDQAFRRAKKGYGSTYGPTASRAQVWDAHQALLDALDRFAMDADADLAALLRDELQACIGRYTALKAERGALDFLDLLLETRHLVAGNDVVRRAFQARFSHLFVDEFQDTDPLQAEILLLLASDDWRVRDWASVRAVPGKLFIVGDPKQSIYRFRRADVQIYERVCGQLTQHGAARLQLTTSFRSVPTIQRAINAAFAQAMVADAHALQADYVAMTPFRTEEGHQPSVVALPVPRPYGLRNVAGYAIEASLPDAVGAFVDWLVHESGWTVTERRGRGAETIPIEARHVCVLFRRFVSWGTDLTRAYVDALEARGVPHLLVGGRSFHNREEIETLRAALTAVEWPDDELSVFAALRGSLFAIGDEDLLEYHHHHGKSFSAFRVPETVPEHLAPIAEALTFIRELHGRRNHVPVADTVGRLLDRTRAHVGFALRRAGEQVLANVLHVAELARQYDLSGGISFRGFVDELRDAAEDGQAAEAPIVEEGSDGVRIMTVHKAKGLEFPVVILADMTANLSQMDASRHLDAPRGLCALRIGGWAPLDLLLQQATEQDRDRAEGVRVAYVAATRARDVLVVPAVGDAPFERWLAPLNAAIYPDPARRRASTSAPRCPSFRKDSVLERPNDETARPSTVCPGLHVFNEGEPDGRYDVAWWDPAVLALGAAPPFGLRREDLISREVEPEVVAEGERRYMAWRAGRAAAIEAGRAPSLTVRTVTEWARATTGDAAAAVETVVVDLTGQRPGGARFGTLVHAALATVPLDAVADLIDPLVQTHGRIVGAGPDEVSAAVEVVTRVLAHPLVRAAAAASAEGRCHREVPVTMLVEGVLVEGVADLAYELPEGWVVVDFKTDRPDRERWSRYARQVRFYGDAIARTTGRPVRAILMQV
jgi:ATP-dependent exoDNAse (exonuclease V) beta subunit